MRMRRIFRVAVSTALLCTVLIPSPVIFSADSRFPDVGTLWYGYQDSIEFLAEKEIITGHPDGTFKPKDPINRAEFLKLAFRSRGSNEPAGGSCFTDVPEDAWFAPYVCAARRREIVNGYDDGTFKPGQTVNTVEALKMLLLVYGHETSEPPGEQWYKPYVTVFDRTNVLPKGTYLPEQPLDRAHAADLIAKMMNHADDRIDPRLSAGCGKAESEARTNLIVSDVERSYLLTKPKNYVSHDPAPLIVAFHGRTNSNAQVRAYFGLDKTATDYFIAYPAALQKDTGTFHWSDPGDKLSTLRDLKFFDAIVQELADTYCIDMNKIFTVGHSLGAWMANSTACARGGIVRGSATVGGNSMIAPCAGPSAALIINNPSDTLSPHSAAEAVRDQRLESNACTDEQRATAPESLNCEAYTNCSTDAPVVWCPHTIDRDDYVGYYPHLWPDDTAETIVEFFGGLD